MQTLTSLEAVESGSRPVIDDAPPLKDDVLFHVMGVALWGTLAGLAVLFVS